MTRLKAHWKLLAVILAPLLWAAWYSRPVDIHTLRPGDPLWPEILEEVEALRFRRPPWNLVRQYLREDVIRTEPAAREALVFNLWDSGGGDLMLQLNGGKPRYTSPYTGQNLPASLSGGKKTAQSLAERLWPLLEEES